MNKEKLKQLRESRGLTSEELAKELRFAKSIMWSYELGKKEPSILHLKKIASYFNVSTDYLLDHHAKQLPINLENGNDMSGYSFLIDDEPISNEEMNEAIAFIRAKRMMRSVGMEN
ncbi:helix-turn-helix transcriptional regulator [Virgibacillus sp. 179-BFC.A HS]|uniref:Helix-turn-helix transcriptional regulator n=1 Tax=Tigheibacillus jepli TaxID=3035914 RepID=A0ABU5CDH6_9BACI|nr:helix-turn-helix transcriptional regulator [Virgibacillus sp. 179-BFC.A HS]MDY0404388.1 helix-turn-helix transcriptional regulator [Virgibacillus sp. 179-BFC.A HS]